MIGFDDHGSPDKVSPEKLGEPDPGQESLPADLIEKAARLAYDTWTGVPRWDEREDLGREAWRVEIRAAAPLLVAHGREREREKWVARIEKLADQEELTNRTRIPRLLRSLLTEGKEA